MSGLVVVLRTWLVRIGFALGSLRPPARRVLLATAVAALGERTNQLVVWNIPGGVRWRRHTH